MMKKIGRILAPTDLSPLSRDGVGYALELARSQGEEVIVYHVIGREEASPYGVEYRDEFLCRGDFRLAKKICAQRQALLVEYLEENFGDLLGEVRVRGEVEVGVPDKRIVEKAKEEGVGMIIMSTRGKSGLPHIIVGSVAKRVVRHAACPVLSIRPGKRPKPVHAAVG
jgi:nucleotide-binding universal stress UspA family protein